MFFTSIDFPKKIRDMFGKGARNCDFCGISPDAVLDYWRRRRRRWMPKKLNAAKGGAGCRKNWTPQSTYVILFQLQDVPVAHLAWASNWGAEVKTDAFKDYTIILWFSIRTRKKYTIICDYTPHGIIIGGVNYEFFLILSPSISGQNSKEYV